MLTLKTVEEKKGSFCCLGAEMKKCQSWDLVLLVSSHLNQGYSANFFGFFSRQLKISR